MAAFPSSPAVARPLPRQQPPALLSPSSLSLFLSEVRSHSSPTGASTPCRRPHQAAAGLFPGATSPLAADPLKPDPIPLLRQSTPVAGLHGSPTPIRSPSLTSEPMVAPPPCAAAPPRAPPPSPNSAAGLLPSADQIRSPRRLLVRASIGRTTSSTTRATFSRTIPKSQPPPSSAIRTPCSPSSPPFGQI